MSKSDKQIAAVGIAVVLLGILLVVRGCGSSSRSNGTEQAVSGMREDKNAYKVLRDEIGLRQIQLNGQEIVVRLDARKVCAAGDFDAIKAELEKRPQTRVLLTVEPPSAGEAIPAPIVRTMSLQELTNGGDFRFALPPSARRASLGIFLCSDGDKIGRCAGKVNVDINKIFTATLQKDWGVAPIADKIYFFQYLLLRDGTLETLTRVNVTPFTFRKIAAYASARLGGSLPEATQTGIQESAQLTRTLKSMPLEETKGADVVLPLPRYDKSVCGKTDPTRKREEPRGKIPDQMQEEIRRAMQRTK